MTNAMSLSNINLTEMTSDEMSLVNGGGGWVDFWSGVGIAAAGVGMVVGAIVAPEVVVPLLVCGYIGCAAGGAVAGYGAGEIVKQNNY